MPTETLPSTAPPAYCSDPFGYARRKTRVVRVGKVPVGGNNPIRVQSMTTTDTLDVEATVAQTLKMVEAGCEIVRITAPTVGDARALGKIKERLLRLGCDVPLVADIHFSPQAAMEAAEYVEKVRINPGNFVDSKRFAVKEYSDEQYAEELSRIEAAFTPLVEKLKRLGRALRIGTNHGSLSDRIMNRYGDTPLGMVESALEYVRICEKNGYRDIILSMKASNPKVMVAAYRLLAARMEELGMDYPFHLGVTEAGDGEDGRIKSAIGIGSLLADGIGDTIRVSLTEDPEYEIPVCYALARPFQPTSLRQVTRPKRVNTLPYDPFYYERRKSRPVSIGPFPAGDAQLVRVVTAFKENPSAEQILAFLEEQLRAAKNLEPEIIEWRVRGGSDLEALSALRARLRAETSRLAFAARFEPPAQPLARGDFDALILEAPSAEELMSLRARMEPETPVLLSLRGEDAGALLKEYRLLASRLKAAGSKELILLRAPVQAEEQEQVLASSVLIGSLLCDGIGDCVQVDSALKPARNLELVYNILQAAGVRVTKTEFVSCPSCGRTLFNLQTTTERIKSKTGHLKGVKIAIMGCIVNGPGEMADADFGYVGGAPDKINLYVGKECVRKGIPAAVADEALIELIKSHGKWVEPPSA